MHGVKNRGPDGKREPELTLRPEELSGIEVLRNAPKEAVWGVLEHCPLLALNAHETLIDKSRIPRAMFLLVSGRLVAHEDGANSGEPVVVERGATLNEESLLGGRPVARRVFAEQPSRVLVVDETAFWRLVGASHAFSANMLVRVTGRLEAGQHSAPQLRPMVELENATDGLTGVHSRQWLDRTLPRLVDRHRRDDRPLSVVGMDVDCLPRINGAFGHMAGDRVLRAIGQLLRWSLRPTDLSARLSGSRFCSMLPNTNVDGARTVAERLRGMVADGQFVNHDGAPITGVSVRVGWTELAPRSEAGELLAAVLGALEGAGKNGGARVGCTSVPS